MTWHLVDCIGLFQKAKDVTGIESPESPEDWVKILHWMMATLPIPLMEPIMGIFSTLFIIPLDPDQLLYIVDQTKQEREIVNIRYKALFN